MRRILKPNITAKGLFCLLSGITLFIVLFIYRGFGIDQGISYSGHSLLARATVFSAANAMVMYLLEFHVRRFITVGKVRGQVLWRFVEIVIGATVIFLIFNFFWKGTEWTWSAYGLLLFEYSAVMIFPVLLTMAFRYSNPGPSPGRVVFFSANGKKRFTLKKSEVLFLKAADNYVEIFYASGGKVRKELIRNTLKELLADPDIASVIFRTHRSYAVNLENVSKLSDQGGEMVLELQGQELPVSKKYRSVVTGRH